VVQSGHCSRQELEKEQEGRGKIEKQTRAEATGSKVKQCRGTQATNAMVSSLTKETEGALTAGSNRTCSNGRSRENKYSNDMP